MQKYVMIAHEKIPDDVLVALFAKGLLAQCLTKQVYFETAKINSCGFRSCGWCWLYFMSDFKSGWL